MRAAVRSRRWPWRARSPAPTGGGLVDLHGDGADSATMGEGANLPGFADLFAGELPSPR